jgi:RNA polymerase sigma factor (TIGR02999 family)
VRREMNPDVVQGTVLVHELYLRLLNQKKAAWDDRRHFYIFCAKVMRMILIDHARENQIKMRGGDSKRVPLKRRPVGQDRQPGAAGPEPRAGRIGRARCGQGQLVELRYFLGCTAEETAALMQVSKPPSIAN